MFVWIVRQFLIGVAKLRSRFQSLEGIVFEIYPRNSNIDTSAVRLGFRVSSVDKVVADLEEIEVVVLSSPRDSQWGRRAVILDPDGYKIELVN